MRIQPFITVSDRYRYENMMTFLEMLKNTVTVRYLAKECTKTVTGTYQTKNNIEFSFFFVKNGWWKQR